MDFGIEELVYEMPPRLVRVDDLAREAGFGEEMIDRLHSGGLKYVPAGGDSPLHKLVRKAVSQLSSAVSDLPLRTRGVIFAHSVPLMAPADVPFLDLCFAGLGIDGAPRVALSGQPCAILHMGVQLASCWLKDLSNGSGILLVGADKAYSAADRIFFGSAMGDVAVAGFITRDTARNQVLASVSQCEVIAYEGENSAPADIARFRKLNPLYIRQAIETCLEKGGVGLVDLSLIVPHTPYTMIWDTMAELLRFPRERILTDYLDETGHLNSNDSFAHYVRAVREGRIQDGDLVLLVNPAFGGTRGCTLIRR